MRLGKGENQSMRGRRGVRYLQFLVKHSLQSYTSECGKQPDRMMLGLNLSRGRGCSSLELSSSMEDSEASNRGEKSAKLV